MDIEIVVIGTRTFKKKDTGQTYYVIDYYRIDNFVPKTDFVSALEYTMINKKIGDKHGIKCLGKRKTNDYDKLYVYDLDIK